MGISLVITWKVKDIEVIRVSSVEGVRKFWIPLARKLRLEFLSELDGYVRLDRDNIYSIGDEFVTFRAECVRLGEGCDQADEKEGYEQTVEKIDRILLALERLKTWRRLDASFG